MEIIIYVLITIIILFLLYKIINANESMEGFTESNPTLHWVGDCHQCNKGVNWCDSSRWVPFERDKFTIGSELADFGCDNINSSTQSTHDPSNGRVYVIEYPNDADSDTRRHERMENDCQKAQDDLKKLCKDNPFMADYGLC